MREPLRLSDEELVYRLQLVEKHGSLAKAAHAYGLAPQSFTRTVKGAKARGLTAKTKLQSVEDKLRTKNRLLEQEIASIRRDNVSAEEIRRTVYSLATLTPDPPRWIEQNRIPHSPGVPVALWSDWHWGEVVRPAEVGGVNSFNRKVARERVKRLVNSTVDLITRHMVNPKYPGMVLCLGGDMISGNIHEELRETNDGPVQLSLLEVQEQLIAAIEHLAGVYKRLFIPCVVGNHGRTTHKPRAKNRVYESFEWNLYCQLEHHFRRDKRVQFSIPEETDAHFNVLGHRFCLTHGDALGVKGGDGIIGAIGPITRGAIKIGRSEAQIGRDFDTLLMGHWHTFIPRGDANGVVVNGSLKGYDEYARLFLRVPYSRPSQALFFTHERHGITAQWQIFVDDKRKSAAAMPWVSWQNQTMKEAA